MSDDRTASVRPEPAERAGGHERVAKTVEHVLSRRRPGAPRPDRLDDPSERVGIEANVVILFDTK